MWQQIFLSSVCILVYIIMKNLDTKQNKVKYFTKVFLMFFYIMIVSTILCPVLIFKKRNLRNALLLTKWIKHTPLIVGMKWQLQNIEYLNGVGGAVIISNHQSTFDALGVFYARDKINKSVALAKKELWWLGPMALAAYMCGIVFIDRKNPKKAYKTLEKLTNVLKDGCKIWIFPEGTRNAESKTKLLPFKKGAFALAVAAQVPIIPIVFSPQYFINENKCILYNNGKVIMRCLEPVPTEGLTSEDVPVLQEKVYKIVLGAFEKLSEEILSELPSDTQFAREILK